MAHLIRLTDNEVKTLYNRYGYRLPDNFHHTNVHTKYPVYDMINDRNDKLSVVQLRYQINRAPIKRPEYQPFPFANMALGDPHEPLDSIERWALRHTGVTTRSDQVTAFNAFVGTMRSLALKRPFDVQFNQGAQDDRRATLYGFIEALKNMDYSQYDVRLTIVSNSGNESYVHANANTIAYLTNVFEGRKDFTDSDAYALNAVDDIATISVEMIPLQNNNRAPGYFPYTHDTDLDLRKYGIYNNEDDLINEGNESCLVTAMRSVLNEDEVALLKSMVKTRYVQRSSLKHMANTFNLAINVKSVTDYVKNKTTHEDIKPLSGINEQTRKVKLLIAYDHYFINECITFEGRKLSILSVIKRLESSGHLKPLSKECIKQLVMQFKCGDERDVRCAVDARRVIVKNKRLTAYQRRNKVAQTKRFFGYDCPKELVDERLAELQEVINQLPLRNQIDVSSYYKFSDLAQSIAYEYGVYDNVYELTGAKAAAIRDTLVFPQTQLVKGKGFYYNSKEHNSKPLYYLDMNAAYMGFAQSIPTGPDGNGSLNTKLAELMEQLYQIRCSVKNEHPELSVTLKFIMNSFYGYSIRRQPIIKTKYVQNPSTYEARNGKFIIKTEGHYISTLKSYCEHYTCPQLAASILGSFNGFLQHVMSLVNVYYINVDAILTDEEGYKKLNSMGYIGNNLRQFKIEKTFDEIAIISSRRYVATLTDGSKVNHLCKNLEYDDVVRIAKDSIKVLQK